MHSTNHLEAGTAPLVHLASGLLEIGPAILPGSSARFHRGRPAAISPGDPLIVSSAGGTPKVGPRRSPEYGARPAPALATHSPAAGGSGAGAGAVGCVQTAAPAHTEGAPCATT